MYVKNTKIFNLLPWLLFLLSKLLKERGIRDATKLLLALSLATPMRVI